MAGKNIEINAEVLRTLHRLHQQTADLANQLERGPRQIKAGEAIVAKHIQSVDDAKEGLKQAKLASDKKQLQLKTREDRIEDLKAKLNTAASNREFDTLKEQIAADEQANSVLSDEILESLERLDELEAELTGLEEELDQQKRDHDKRVQEVNERLEVVRADSEHVAQELAKAEEEIPSQIRAEYRRLTESKGEEALAPLDDDSCGGCYQVLTTQLIDQLRLSQVVHCPNCNAMLYMAESTRVK